MSVSSNLGRFAATTVESVGSEIEPECIALPRDWARAFSVALALSMAERCRCAWQRADVDDELCPLVASWLEDGPPRSAFPSGHHDGGHGLLFGSLLEDPTQ